MDGDRMNIENEIHLCRIIGSIKQNYGLYIGEKSLTYLSHFLNGYRYRFFEEQQYLFSFQKEFQVYIEKLYQIENGRAWNEIIKNGLSEKDAFDMFFRLLEQFLQESEYGAYIYSADHGTVF